MNSINPIERITQNRIIGLFHKELGYEYYGDWEGRNGNSNIEAAYLRAFLEKQAIIASFMPRSGYPFVEQ